ncbi:hypothetical protein [Microbacterium terricola]|uniref:Uncharacterized protein n=1 Tax=Microbacterium terricola TaxID=344163 RepID=A0ABM8E0W1_9MICO|nr:hypothetical protein [Microbacterium terricola]UYK40701.1 hypothetical protein OAU46_03350 [Microbacterium terricola]BDV31563.1 hypothetical protein Microterr_22230 [Microbacterium terricola]
MPTDDEMKFQTGASNFGEDWTQEAEEAALHILLVGKRRDPEMQGALAEALGRTLNGVDWKIDAMASNLDDFRTANENPLGLNATEVKLLADYQRVPVEVAERCRLSHERLVAGEIPAALSAERRREEQEARTCGSCFTEFAADGSCMCM